MSTWLPGEIGEHVYDIDQPHISIHYCPHCSRFFDGDFGVMGVCNNCLYEAEQKAIKEKEEAIKLGLCIVCKAEVSKHCEHK